MTDVFKDLPRLKWRGIEVPIAQRSVSFEQEHAIHKYAYRDDELIEALGRKNWRFRYTIPFREDIRKGPYKNLYVATFSTFLQACRDRSEGSLEDPILGEYQARCVDVSIDTDVNRRDGEDVQVSFVHSPAPDEREATGAVALGLAGAVQDGKSFNDQISKVAVQITGAGPVTALPPVVQKQVEEINGFVNPLQALDQIASLGAQVAAYADRIDATIAQFEHKINKVSDILEDIDQKLLTPQNAPILRSGRRLLDSVAKLGKSIPIPGATIVPYTVLQDTTVGPLVQLLGMNIEQYILLNPTNTGPLIPAGTIVYYVRVDEPFFA